MNLWYTADPHINHMNIIRYCKRPFSCVEEMNEAIVDNWNSVVRDGDVVRILGDVAYGKNFEQAAVIHVPRLKGTKHLIRGNHDRKRIRPGVHVYPVDYLFASARDYEEMYVGDQEIHLFHYAMRTWPHDLRGSWHLYGHSHGALPGHGKSFDIGMDCWGFRPVSYDEVKAKMDTLLIASGTPSFHCDQCNRFPCECDDEKTA